MSRHDRRRVAVEVVRRLLPIAADPDGRALPYYATQALDETAPMVSRVVVVLHGIERDGIRYFRHLARVVAARPDGAATLIIAPQFSTRRDLQRLDASRDDTLAWRGHTWKEGAESRSGVSSFSVMDSLLQPFASRTTYPDLRHVVVAGHSAGAQFVQRYAGANPVEETLRERGVAVRYVVANPSSYLYLDPSRPGFGPDGEPAPPPPAIVAQCPSFDRYKYGLQRLNPYLKAVGAGLIVRRYGEREIVYLLGEHDDDPRHKSLDRTPPAMLQGPHRMARGVGFQRHLFRLYGPMISSRHRLVIVPAIGHQGTHLFRSPTGLRWLLDLPPP